MAIIGKPVVVKFLQSGSTDLEATRQTSDVSIAFEHFDIESATSQVVRGGQPAEACSDNYNGMTSMIGHVAFLSEGQMAIDGRDGLNVCAGSRPRRTTVSGNQSNR
jgi:hypothetical protein